MGKRGWAEEGGRSPAAVEMSAQGSQRRGWLSPVSLPSVISPGKLVCVAPVLPKHI